MKKQIIQYKHLSWREGWQRRNIFKIKSSQLSRAKTIMHTPPIVGNFKGKLYDFGRF